MGRPHNPEAFAGTTASDNNNRNHIVHKENPLKPSGLGDIYD